MFSTLDSPASPEAGSVARCRRRSGRLGRADVDAAGVHQDGAGHPRGAASPGAAAHHAALLADRWAAPVSRGALGPVA